MPYIPETLQSIADQTYHNHQIIAWDNGSTDGTVEELRRWIPSRINGQIVSNRPLRLGPSLAAMVDLATTDLCAVIHGDDINHAGRLSEQVVFLQAHPEVGIVGGQSDFIDENGDPTGGWQFPCDDATLRWRCRWMAQLMHSATMFRTAVIRQAGNYRDYQPYEDMELWIRASAVTEFANLPGSIIKYRRSSTSQTGKFTEFKSIFREGARVNAERLFPNLGARAATELWEATYPGEETAPAQFSMLRRFNRVALDLARQLGKPDHYFRSTASFQEQRYYLRRRVLRSYGLDPLLKFGHPRP